MRQRGRCVGVEIESACCELGLAKLKLELGRDRDKMRGRRAGGDTEFALGGTNAGVAEEEGGDVCELGVRSAVAGRLVVTVGCVGRGERWGWVERLVHCVNKGTCNEGCWGGGTWGACSWCGRRGGGVSWVVSDVAVVVFVVMGLGGTIRRKCQ